MFLIKNAEDMMHTKCFLNMTQAHILAALHRLRQILGGCRVLASIGG
jgi:hypothetical protein